MEPQPSDGVKVRSAELLKALTIVRLDSEPFLPVDIDLEEPPLPSESNKKKARLCEEIQGRVGPFVDSLPDGAQRLPLNFSSSKIV
jgi:hypothetical protein